MSMNILNDISAVYLQQVAEKKDDSYLETDMKKRHENNEKAREEMKRTKANKDMVKAARKSMGVEDDDDDDDDDINEAVKGDDTEMRKAASVERRSGDKRLAPSKGKGYADQQKQSIAYMDKVTKKNKNVVGLVTKEALDPVGKEDSDVDNDGDSDKSDKYLLNRRKAIGKAMKREKVKESFSNWRQDLAEVMDDVESEKEIKEKKVNNKIKINPEMKESVEELGGELIEMVEVDEESYMDYSKRKAAEKKDTRMTVTAADKKGNTPAYKNYKAGDKRYKAAAGLGEEVLDEKALSKQQQKFMGMVYAVKKGEMKAPSPEVAKAAAGMSKKSARDFAKTKHKGLPKKVEEELQPTTPQQFAAQKQLTSAQKKLTTADQASLKLKQKEMQQREEFVSEEDYDRMKDRHLERGGMGVRSSTSFTKMSSSKPVDKEKQKETARRALELVRKQIISKYGKGSLM